MNHSALAAGVRQIRGAIAAQRRCEDSDEQLLHAFADHGDETAFAVLVRRHGPMVMGVCRRVLRHQQDAEDAFQATFLMLAQNAATLRDRTALAGFLHGTAYRLAVMAIRSAARRRKHERQAPVRSTNSPSGELLWREVQTLLDEEIARLPDAYRSVFVLCCLEGLSHAKAARRLGVKEVTVSSRLAGARKRLRQRLARRGVDLTAVLAATALTMESAPAQAAALLGRTSRVAVSPSVAELAESAAPLWGVGKAKLVAVLLLAMSALAGAGAWACRGLNAHAIATPAPPPEPPAAKADDKSKTAPPRHESVKTVEIRGRVLAPDGKPKAGAKLFLLSGKGKTTPLGVTAENGRFTVTVPKEAAKHDDYWLVSQADGAGLDFLDLYLFKNKKPVELRLVKDNAIRGRVVNTEGKPIRGVRVTAQEIRVYGNNSLDTFRDRWMKLWAGGSGDGQVKAIYLGLEALFATTTDADGRFVLEGLGAERTVRIRLRGAGIADTSVFVANRAGLDPKPFNQAIFDHVQKGHMNYRWSILSGPDVTVVAEAEKIIRGVVTDADTGKGQPGMIVRLPRDSDELIHFPPEAKTDAHGRYEIHGVRKTKRYLLCVDDNKDTGHMPSQVWADDTVAHQPVHADIKVKKGVIITGRIIDGATGESLPGCVMGVVLRGNPFGKDYPRFDEFHGLGQQNSFDRIDGNQAFRIVAIPGPMLLMGKTEGEDKAVYKYKGADPKYPQYFTENGDGYYGYDHMAPLQGIWNGVLELKPDVREVKHDIVLEREKILAEVRIQDAEGRPLAGAWGLRIIPNAACAACRFGIGQKVVPARSTAMRAANRCGLFSTKPTAGLPAH